MANLCGSSAGSLRYGAQYIKGFGVPQSLGCKDYTGFSSFYRTPIVQSCITVVCLIVMGIPVRNQTLITKIFVRSKNNKLRMARRDCHWFNVR